MAGFAESDILTIFRARQVGNIGILQSFCPYQIQDGRTCGFNNRNQIKAQL